jgi:hypothetical protein
MWTSLVFSFLPVRGSSAGAAFADLVTSAPCGCRQCQSVLSVGEKIAESSLSIAQGASSTSRIVGTSDFTGVDDINYQLKEVRKRLFVFDSDFVITKGY